jgi:hypothetical protein
MVAGMFGAIVTVGLLFYELKGIQRCIRLYKVGAELESRMDISGQFKRWPHSARRFINEPVAAAFIYSTVLAAWIFIAITSISPGGAIAGQAFHFWSPSGPFGVSTYT